MSNDKSNHCPYCGQNNYMEQYGVTTSAYYPPIYMNDVNINLDKNKTTVYCVCLNCGKDFSFERL